MNSHSVSPVLPDETDTNSNKQPSTMYSDDEKLETIGRKVSAIINGNIFSDTRTSDNGNISSENDKTYTKKRCTDCKEERESTEDAANDSFTDEDCETYNHLALRRKR